MCDNVEQAIARRVKEVVAGYVVEWRMARLKEAIRAYKKEMGD